MARLAPGAISLVVERIETSMAGTDTSFTAVATYCEDVNTQKEAAKRPGRTISTWTRSTAIDRDGRDGFTAPSASEASREPAT